MEKIDITIIGAGVVGLAIAERLSASDKSVLVIEKNERFGMETSSRNSEVIHSGIYYPHNTLKARLCLSGNTALYELCKKKNVPHSRVGKIVVATASEEIEPLEKLYKRGLDNGVQGLSLITQQQIKSYEPDVSACAGLMVPSTGIIDSEQFMSYLFVSAEEHDAMFMFKNYVSSIKKTDKDSYIIGISPQNEFFETQYLINAAGLQSDTIAALAGIDIKREGYKLKFYKGEYYCLKPSTGYNFSRLVYPLPEGDGTSLGIHLTLNLNDQVRFGPNRYYVEKIDYAMDESYKKKFIEAIKRYLPGIKEADLIPDTCGIRPQIGKNSVFQDFIIQEESDKGLPGLINCIGIESPGLTAAPAIAEYVADMIR